VKTQITFLMMAAMNANLNVNKHAVSVFQDNAHNATLDGNWLISNVSQFVVMD
jgi:uncharacterized protein (DUF2141 family)